MLIVGLLICETIMGLAMAALIVAQAGKLRQVKLSIWEKEREAVEALVTVDRLRAELAGERASNSAIVSRFLQLAERPPVIIEPPDVSSIVKSIGESIGEVVYGRYAEQAGQEMQQTLETSMGSIGFDHRAGEKSPVVIPDIEFDDWLPPDDQIIPGENETPVHRLMTNGQVRRQDGQPLFQSGVGAEQPAGGIE